MEYRFPVFYSNLFLAHDTGGGHPENAGRLTAIVDYLERATEKASGNAPENMPKTASGTALKTGGLTGEKSSVSAPLCHPSWAEKISWIEPSEREVLTDICRVHDSAYVHALEAFAKRGGGYLDGGDTVVSPQSYEVALLAVAAWLDGVDWVCTQPSQSSRRSAFVLARPPGHHAEGDRGMGFCLLSNAAIAAHYALSRLELGKVAIFDWDVHHGNGTQALISANPGLAYCSFHQSPAYPGTGAASETGGHNNVLNLPVPPGSTLGDYQKLWFEKAEPFLSDFGADLLIVSAGYDANRDDPLAGVALHPEDYGWFTQQCMQFGVPVLFGLEGGYDYPSLAKSVAETIRCAIGDEG